MIRDEYESAVVRLDAWLWAARFYKTRALAKQAITNGRVVIDGAACKPSRPVHVGDRMQITRGEERFDIEVLALADKRGSAAIAQTLYRESDISRAAREALREQRRAERTGYRARQAGQAGAAIDQGAWRYRSDVKERAVLSAKDATAANRCEEKNELLYSRSLRVLRTRSSRSRGQSNDFNL